MLLVTGFPGLIGSELLPRLLAQDPARRAACLVQPQYAEQARQTLLRLDTPALRLSSRVRLVGADITEPGLAMTDTSRLREVTDVWHLAGIYDTTAPLVLASRVNVEGTRHMLDLAKELPRLRRFHHVSTCYVSGDHPGVFREEDLDLGQGFRSVYDQTKFRAEVEVRHAAAGGLPVTIYRPASVVGDSRTGWTQKYDGPYFVFRLLLRQPAALAFVPRFVDPATVFFNVVPLDFVVDALAALSARDDSPGKTFQVADPGVMSVADLVAGAGEATGRRVVWLPLPLRPARRLAALPGVKGLVQIPAPVFLWMASTTTYTSTNTQAALAGTGIHCPPFDSYVGRLVEFMREHPDVTSASMA